MRKSWIHASRKDNWNIWSSDWTLAQKTIRGSQLRSSTAPRNFRSSTRGTRIDQREPHGQVDPGEGVVQGKTARLIKGTHVEGRIDKLLQPGRRVARRGPNGIPVQHADSTRRLHLTNQLLCRRYGRGRRRVFLLQALHPATKHFDTTIPKRPLLAAQARQTTQGFSERLLRRLNLFRHFLLFRKI